MEEHHIQAFAILSDDIEKSTHEGTLFDEDILKDLSCKHFKATAFVYDAATTVTKLDNGEVKSVSHYTCCKIDVTAKRKPSMKLGTEVMK